MLFILFKIVTGTLHGMGACKIGAHASHEFTRGVNTDNDDEPAAYNSDLRPLLGSTTSKVNTQQNIAELWLGRLRIVAFVLTISVFAIIALAWFQVGNNLLNEPKLE